MMRFWGAVVAAILVVSFGAGRAVGDDNEAAKKALKALEGNWQLVAQEEFGNVTPKPVVSRLRVVIEDGQMSWYIGNPASNMDATLTVDPAKDPKAIDAKITKSSAIGKTMLGIYKLDKDTLEICWGVPGGDKRPTKFTAKAGVGSGNTYTKYEREKEKEEPKAKVDPNVKVDPKKELKALEGNWQLVVQEERGFPTPKGVVSRLRVVIEGDQMSWYIGNPASNMDATITIDPSKDPKAIDAKVTKSSVIGKTMLGIYRLDKDTLVICWNEPGNEKRPTKFVSRAGVGSGNVYTKYEREKEKK